jgi:DNA-binding winged helix-turn-helix (wHTH) protein
MTQVAICLHPAPDELRFRTSSVRPKERLWLRNGKPVEVGGRAFDLLVTLLTHRGRVCAKTVILERVWPHATVVEGALRVQMVQLRRALGTDAELIKTIPGQGYFFAEDHAAIGMRAIG